MALDGLVIHSIVDELSSKLTGGKIDKIHQPEDDEVIFNIRNNKENFRLVLSASASNPRVYLTSNYQKENPLKAPMFCMLLRKYIQGGNIVEISQIGFERIIKISVESLDELKEKTVKNIMIEIMGRHSNIIITHGEENKIIDSIKRVPFSISRVRQVLPGHDYSLPPEQNKLNPLDAISKDLFIKNLEESEGPIFKSIYSKFLGISPIIAKEICYRAGVNQNTIIKDISDEQFDSLHKVFCNLFNDINSNKYSPCIIIDKKVDKVVDFSCINLTLFSDLSYINKDSMSRILEDFYRTKDIKDRINQRSSDLKKSIAVKLDRLYNKLKKQEEELSESENADIYKIKGELITSYIYMVDKGMESIEVANFYDENCNDVTIELNKNLTPSENAQKYFKKYNKMKHAKVEISHQISLNKEEIDYLENIILSIENCENLAELQDIKEELAKVGYIKTQKKNSKKDTIPSTKPHEFVSSDGFKILVGKNNKQNDYLTLRLADNDDLWMHTKNIPGSHVIIKCAGKEVPDNTVFEGAMLAAFFSKSKLSSQVPVDYTKRKNVKKPSGSKPGMVIYETNSTIYVTPEEETVAKLKVKSE
ncbi:NFACT family protein [Clostridioides difficile]|uniref:Rqc2 family fibronectin-binding protein n=1 Tax=Clostridioides difficile TaxID=1496 RepID=UPI00038CF57F|nr:NFACT RNA binding domain-containing protein [Clostridioides difficile]EQE84010.1 fibronectin-binding A family protein [Clostridioides difficile CD69]MBY1130821.1 NFACT family protein [Clostridioides difficile]MBY1885091.1 NFACT family protein [Clostridioides difficile]MBZ0779740.1 NFACT family protein [Clostridioides difficile]MBZ0853890.1 NFACT family protein [Clostridioides difficile]